MLYSGYGEQSNNQEAIRAQGKAFFDTNYPKLDKIVTATIVPLVPTAAGASGAARPHTTVAVARKSTAAIRKATTKQ